MLSPHVVLVGLELLVSGPGLEQPGRAAGAHSVRVELMWLELTAIAGAAMTGEAELRLELAGVGVAVVGVGDGRPWGGGGLSSRVEKKSKLK